MHELGLRVLLESITPLGLSLLISGRAGLHALMGCALLNECHEKSSSKVGMLLGVAGMSAIVRAPQHEMVSMVESHGVGGRFRLHLDEVSM